MSEISKEASACMDDISTWYFPTGVVGRMNTLERIQQAIDAATEKLRADNAELKKRLESMTRKFIEALPCHDE